jgi:uncharacterized integral membrane protein
MTSDPGTPPDSAVTATPDTHAAPTTSSSPETPAHAAPKENAEKRTRAAAVWTGIILGLLILILLLIFITQNMNSVTTTFLFWKTDLPLGVTILVAAVAGALITALVGAVRIVQLRRAAKKNLKA